MYRGSGKYSNRDINKILKKNGYRVTRNNGHYIYENDNGDTIAIPYNCKNSTLMREFKNHNIDINRR